MDDLDGALTRLAEAPVPTALDRLDDRVLRRIEAGPATRYAGAGIAAVTAGALVLGMASTSWPATAAPSASLTPIGGGSPLTPSTLLAGEP